MSEEKTFCPKCKSENVELTTSFVIGANYPAPHLAMNKCKDCGLESPFFPTKEKILEKVDEKEQTNNDKEGN